MKFATSFLFFLIFTVTTYAQKSATDILKDAQAQAKAENKKVFIKYGASWCTWCKKMDKQMKNDVCAPLFDKNYVSVNLTVLESFNNKSLETPGGVELLKKHKGASAGLPFWLILDENGEIVETSFDEKGDNLGCPASREEIDVFIKKLKKTSNLSETELSTIASEFRRR